VLVPGLLPALLHLLAGCAGSNAPAETGTDPAPVGPPACIEPRDTLTYTDVALPLSTADDDQGRKEEGGAALVDLDNDGDDDLVLAVRGAGIYLLWNEAGAFPSPLLLSTLDRVTTIVAVDLDDDGDLDLLAATTKGTGALLVNEAGAFVEAALPFNVSGLNVRQISLGDADGDGDLDVYVASSGGRADPLFLNDGGGQFEDVTDRLPTESDDGLGWMGLWLDVDDDGDADLYTVNADQAANDPSRLLLNDGTAHFVDGSAGCACDWQGSPMGASVVDLDGDTLPDLLFTNSGPSVLYLNTGEAAFIDVGQALGASVWPADSTMSFGSAVFDAENDGYLDALLSFGPLYDGPGGSQPAEQSDLFLRGAEGGFTEAGAALGLDDPGSGRAVLTGLINNDGTPDLVVVNLGTDSRVRVASCSEAHTLVVDLEGAPPNRFAIGARVQVSTEGGDTFTRWVLGASGYGAWVHPRAHFGLGEANASTVQVLWPSGAVTETAVPAGTWRITISETAP
jgi:hypothetical protein